MNMAPSQPMSPRTSSAKPLISGSPSISGGLREFADSISSKFDTAVSLALMYARTDLRKAAHQSHAWSPFEDILDVEFDGENFVYALTGSPEQNAQAMAVEYGTPERSPESLLRKKALSHTAILGKVLGDYLSKEVPSA